MRALRFHAAKDLRIDDIPPPAAPGEGEVRIRNIKAGICGTDLHEYAHGPIFIPVKPHPYSGTSGPQILGHEFGGVVEAVGNGVDHVKPGDRVSVLPHIMRRDKGYFAERGLFTLADDIAFVGLSSAWGGMAEKSMLRYDTVHKVPDALTDEEAALVEPTAVVVYACDRGGVRPGSTVLVTGAGPIGVLAVLAARAAGATKIFLSDTNPVRLKLARTILPDVVTIDARSETVGDRVRAETIEHVGVDVAMECVGAEKALGDCVDAVRRQGVVVQVGLHPSPSKIDWFSMVYKDIDIRGSWTYPNHCWPRVMDLIASGILPAGKVVTKRVGLDDAVEHGFEALLDPAGADLKIMIDVAA